MPRRASQVVIVVKNLPVNAGDAGDVGSIPGLGRSPGGGYWFPWGQLLWDLLKCISECSLWVPKYWHQRRPWTRSQRYLAKNRASARFVRHTSRKLTKAYADQSLQWKVRGVSCREVVPATMCPKQCVQIYSWRGCGTTKVGWRGLVRLLLLFGHKVVFDSLWPRELQHARLLCPLLSPGHRDWTWVSCIAGRFFTIWATGEAPLSPRICSNSCPLSWWCYLTPTRGNHIISSRHVQMWKLYHKEGWVPKNWCFQTVVLEKTLESPLDFKIKPVSPKGNQPWILIGRTDCEAEVPTLWPTDGKSQLIGKDPNAGKDWRQEEKDMAEDEIVK